MSEICKTCGLPTDLCTCEERAKAEQQINIRTEKRTYGKLVTIVCGLDGSAVDIKDLASQLKRTCACGGTVKNGEIELQGFHIKKVKNKLNTLGFSIGS